MSQVTQVCLLGYGEVGQTLAADLARKRYLALCAYDIKFPDPDSVPHAEAFVPVAESLGFSGARYYSVELGRASAAKMCRSVIIKGMEALLTEALLPARRFGVESEVLDSLQNLLPGVDWTAQARYLITRSVEHGTRRAEEMIEVAQTVRAAGLEPLMSEACAGRQAWAPRFCAALQEAALGDMLDAILEILNTSTGQPETTT